MRFRYSRLCRRYPKTIEAIDRWHITYQENLRDVFSLEKEGTVYELKDHSKFYFFKKVLPAAHFHNII